MIYFSLPYHRVGTDVNRTVAITESKGTKLSNVKMSDSRRIDLFLQDGCFHIRQNFPLFFLEEL